LTLVGAGLGFGAATVLTIVQGDVAIVPDRFPSERRVIA